MKLKTLLVLIIACTQVQAYAQKDDDTNLKYGDITAQDFATNIYSVDSAAQAVVLYDKGTAKYESNNDGWFNIIYTYHKRVRLLNKNAFDLATKKIGLYVNKDSEEKLDKLEAATYNIINGKVVKTPLEKSSIFKDKESKNYTINKFTFPNITEGCIIEYTYTITSPRAESLRGWYFQGQYPVLLSKYEVNIPQLFNYIHIKGGYYDLPAYNVSQINHIYSIYLNRNTGSATQILKYNAVDIHSEWVAKNLPAIIPENFTTSIDNHVSKIEFQLRSLEYPDQPSQMYLPTWPELAKSLLANVYFGADLADNNRYMSDVVNPLTVANNSMATAKAIFNYVKQNFVNTEGESIYLNETLKRSFESKKGSVGDINLVLIAMLRKADIKAYPVLLSTRSNGLASEYYPLISRFNYVIAQVVINGNTYLLDASHKHYGFNFLPEECYNGSGRLIAEMPYLIPLSADSLVEKKNTDIFIMNSSAPNKMEGSFTSKLGKFESHDLRTTLDKTTKEDYFKKIQSGFIGDIKCTNLDLINVKDDDVQASIAYDINFTTGDDIIYFNPMLGEAYKKNPFKSAVRNYPIEMPYQTQESVVVNMEVPKGYKVDEVPKSVRMLLPDSLGMFEYIVQVDPDVILIQCKILINQANFNAADYDMLREFYGLIVKKQAEQIVFKKK